MDRIAISTPQPTLRLVGNITIIDPEAVLRERDYQRERIERCRRALRYRQAAEQLNALREREATP